jgi:hypothetical protein
VRAVEISGQVEVPRDALVPEPSTGALRPRHRARSLSKRVTYRLALSKFHDVTKMKRGRRDLPVRVCPPLERRDRQVDRATALLRDRLAAVRVAKVESEIRDFGDLQVFLETPVIEVYLRRAAEAAEAPAIAPPWSPVPWQLVVLMEGSGDARARGVFRRTKPAPRGAMARPRARRKLVGALGPIAESFERRAYVPEGSRAW